MLRFLYLLTLLICIDWTISYNYIEDSSGTSAYNLGRHGKKGRKASRRKDRNALVRQEFEYDKSPVEFDVASFIQPNYDSIEDDDAYKQRGKDRQQSISKNFDFERNFDSDASLNIKNRDADQESITELNYIPPSLKDTLKSNHMNENSLDKTNVMAANGHDKQRYSKLHHKMPLDQHFVHHPEKKCILRHMKIPFFSHNKTDATTKKNKKRKLICFDCIKKKDNERSTTPAIQYKIKRSYLERLCPSCKKRYIADLPSANKKNKDVTKSHNSNKWLPKTLKDKFKHETKSKEIVADTIRNKREENTREQFLKELEEVQRKIDSVSISVPKFQQVEGNK